MATNKSIEVRHIPALDADAIVYIDKFGLIDTATGEPITYTAEQAVFSISESERAKLQLTLGEGLLWDDVEKSFSIVIRNSQLRFVREDSEFEHALSVKWSGNQLAETIVEGTVTAVRVA